MGHYRKIKKYLCNFTNRLRWAMHNAPVSEEAANDKINSLYVRFSSSKVPQFSPNSKSHRLSESSVPLFLMYSLMLRSQKYYCMTCLTNTEMFPI
jgi:hypothetical protein